MYSIVSKPGQTCPGQRLYKKQPILDSAGNVMFPGFPVVEYIRVTLCYPCRERFARFPDIVHKTVIVHYIPETGYFNSGKMPGKEGFTMNNSVELSAVVLSIDGQESVLSEKIELAISVLNGKNKGSAGDVKKSVDDAMQDVNKALSVLNKSLARKYYLEHELFDIVKSGKAVQCKVCSVESDDETGKYSVTLSDDVCYPTLSGLNSAGLLPEGLSDKVDLLRREVAYLKSGKKAKVYLTGDVENKKDVPSKGVAKLIANEGEISVNKTKSTMQVVLHDLTGGEYKKEVFTALYKDFAGYITKRGAEWTERNMVSKGVAGDMVLEYAYMYFNDLRDVKYTLG